MKPRILFLEDDRYAASAICEALRDEGLDVEYFDTIDPAVARSRECNFDVAILDVRVAPGDSFDVVTTAGGFETGLVFARHLRQQNPGIGIVLISGENSDAARDWSAKHNACFYWKSQLNREDLLRTVRAISQNSTSQRLLPVFRVLDRFHRVAKNLEIRRDARPTLLIQDEYDAQDLLRALLVMEFSDIRAEEWVPSYAGGASRVDFFLPECRVVIEVKYVTARLRDKPIGEQLVIDYARYRGLANCDTLVCFVYDPDSQLQNPTGLRADLEALSDARLIVVVRICP